MGLTKHKKIALIAGLGVLAWLYLDEQGNGWLTDLIEGEDRPLSCGPVHRKAVNAEGEEFCEPKLHCRDNLVLSPDATRCFSKDNPCGPGFKMNADDECEPDDSICGNKCYRLNDAKDDCVLIPGCGTATGNVWGDFALYFGESIVLGVIYDRAGRKVATVAERYLAKKAADKAAAKVLEATTSKSAALITSKATSKVGNQLAQNAAKTALSKLSGAIGSRLAIKNAATLVAKKIAVKVATMVAKISALSSTGIGALLTPLSAVALGLTIGLTASGTFYEKEKPTDKAWSDLPEALSTAVEAIPGIGDIISILGNFIAFRDECAPGLVDQNSLCYDPPKPGFECEAFLCYAKASSYPFDGLSETFAHMTKRILTDTGTIPQTCPPGSEHGDGGIFCYYKPEWARKIVLGTAWEGCRPGMTETIGRCERFHDVGAGTIPPKKGCYDYQRAEGWQNSRDDGTSCWEDWKANCRLTGWSLTDDSCFGGCGCIKKTDMERRYCPNGDKIDGLCYNSCPAGMWHVPGMPYLCTDSYNQRSEVLAPHGNQCEPGKRDIDGLCYADDAHIPAGYRRVTLGLLDQNCPQDKEEWKGYENFNRTADIGVSCQKATYTRKPFPKLSIYAMKKTIIADPPDPPLPGLCSDKKVFPDLQESDPKWKTRLCREQDPPPGYELTKDGLTFYKKCKDLFVYNLTNGKCEKPSDDGKTFDNYDNVDGLLEVSYDFV